MREVEGAEAADAGFTLIELMVVLLIIAILLAIAIPTFLGVTGSANDRAAQSNLTTPSPRPRRCTRTARPTASLHVPRARCLWPRCSRRLLSSAGRPGNVSPKGNNISIEPVDVTTTAGTGDGLIMAAESKNANTCWYAVDL